MPNTAKKKSFTEDAASEPKIGTEFVAESGIDDFDFGSLDDLATMMVEALTIPLPADFRDAGPVDSNTADALKTSALQPPSSKRVN